MSKSLRPYWLEHVRPCLSPSPRACANSCPSCLWCHPTMLSSVIPFSFWLKSFLASGSFPMSRIFASGGQSIGVSASVSVLPMNIQDWFPLGLTGFSPCCLQEISQESSPTPQFKSINSLAHSLLYGPTLTSVHDYWKNHSFDHMDLCWQMSLLFNMLSRFVTTRLPRSKHLLISWLQSPYAVILEPKKIKSLTVSIVSPSNCHQVMGPDAMILALWMFSFKPAFSLSSFNFIKRFFSSSLLSAIIVVSSAYLRLLIFPPAILIPVCASSSLAFHMMYSA